MIPDRDWQVEIAVSENGEPWRTLAHGFWRTGKQYPDLDGHPIPSAVLEKLIQIEVQPSSSSGGTSNTPHGERLYQMSLSEIDPNKPPEAFNSEFTEGSALPDSPQKYPFTK